ncbi:MAG: response regulator [Lachnospiraceae bacterium]|nr:response regulator [Lachnospiraceae bacterium]
MDDKILIVSTAETFTVRGLEMKLKGIEIDVIFSELSVKRLKGIKDDIGLVILYTDGITKEHNDALVFLKDFCLENNSMIIVIGTEIEYEGVKKYIPQGGILDFYERPLAMDKLLDEVEEFVSREDEYSKRKSVLIVDDDMAYMTMVFEWLKDIYHVSIANSGMQAITWLAKNDADLILLDYEMPVTSGPQVLEMIRSEASTADIPVMFLTGKNDKESIMKVLDLKPTDYLLKTIDKQALRDKLDLFFKMQMAEG